MKGRRVLRSIVATGLSTIVCLGGGGQEDSPKEQAAALAKKAKRAAKSGHAADAYLLYSEASAIEPKNRKLAAQMQALQARAAEQSPPVVLDAGDSSELVPPVVLMAEGVFDSLTAAEYARAQQPLPPPSLKGKPGLQDFDLSGPPRTLFDQVAQRFGIQTVYDGDYPASGQPVRFRVPGVDFREALHDLEAVTNSFVVPISSSLVIVAQDTPQKRNDLEQTMYLTVPVPTAMTTAELTEIGQAVKQATNVDKLALDTTHGEILIRDRVSRALPAQALIEQLVSNRPQVMIELEFLDVSDSDLMNYGFNVTNQFSAIYLGKILNNVVTFPQGVTALLTFGGGKTLIGLSVAQASAMFNQSISSARNLYRAQARSVDGQAATFHVGEKYPIITQQYAGSVAPGQQGNVFAPPPSFTYENLGLEVKVTPRIHGTDDVTLAVETTFELLTGSAVNSIPIIGRREVKTQVRLLDGEWAIVGGLMSSTDSKARSGFWGLSQIPLLGNLFTQTSTDKERANVLIAMRPHLLSLPPDQIVTKALRVGTETRPFNPL
ncbi:MAG TPA: type II and III secretion system protein [Bryobacteraceae bacterium]|nr:type II and III secretion system protein [Bryobacteraceae bacterium]